MLEGFFVLVSGLKKGLTVAFLGGGLLAAAFATAGEAGAAEISSSAVTYPARIDVQHEDVKADRADQKRTPEEHASREAPRQRTPQNRVQRANAPANAQTMLASYYGRELEGNPTASGEPFDADAYTAAHKTLPLGTRLRVSLGGESVVVTVNDRGPYVAGRDLDLSLAAARDIGLTYSGEALVRVVVL